MGYTMTAQQPYPDFNKEKITDQSENSVDNNDCSLIIYTLFDLILYLFSVITITGKQKFCTFASDFRK